jgi:hypothetical protein
MTDKSCCLVLQELAEECKGLEEALQVTDEVQASQPQWPELRRDIEASLRAALAEADEAKHQLVCAGLRLFFFNAPRCVFDFVCFDRVRSLGNGKQLCTSVSSVKSEI